MPANVDAFEDYLRDKYREVLQGHANGAPMLDLIPRLEAGAFELKLIEIKKSEQGKGHGGRIMEEICDFADKHNLIVVLSPSEIKTAKLIKWYKEFDFLENKNRNKDFRFMSRMIRYPHGMTRSKWIDANPVTAAKGNWWPKVWFEYGVTEEDLAYLHAVANNDTEYLGDYCKKANYSGTLYRKTEADEENHNTFWTEESSVADSFNGKLRAIKYSGPIWPVSEYLVNNEGRLSKIEHDVSYDINHPEAITYDTLFEEGDLDVLWGLLKYGLKYNHGEIDTVIIPEGHLKNVEIRTVAIGGKVVAASNLKFLHVSNHPETPTIRTVEKSAPGRIDRTPREAGVAGLKGDWKKGGYEFYVSDLGKNDTRGWEYFMETDSWGCLYLKDKNGNEYTDHENEGTEMSKILGYELVKSGECVQDMGYKYPFVYCVDSAGSMVGFAIAGSPEIIGNYVDPRHRRKGIAIQMHKELEKANGKKIDPGSLSEDGRKLWKGKELKGIAAVDVSKIQVPNKPNLDVPRRNMPQIKRKHLDKFVDWLEDEGVSVKEVKMSVMDLKPTQKDFNLHKVHLMLNEDKDKLSKPLLISKDKFILDGHHKWLAQFNIDEKKKVNCIQVGLTAKEFLVKSKEFSKVRYKDINDNTFKSTDPELAYAGLVDDALDAYCAFHYSDDDLTVDEYEEDFIDSVSKLPVKQIPWEDLMVIHTDDLYPGSVETMYIKNTHEKFIERTLKEAIYVFADKGKKYVLDGQHRLSTHVKRGSKTVPAVVFTLEDFAGGREHPELYRDSVNSLSYKPIKQLIKVSASLSNKFEKALEKIKEGYSNGVYTGYLNPIEYETELREDLGSLIGKPIYRAVRLDHENKLDRKNIGIYWTWDKSRAVTYWGHEGNCVVSLESKVTEDNIDWEATIEQWMKPQYNGECEVRLRPRSRIDVTNVWVNKIQKEKRFTAVAHWSDTHRSAIDV